MIKIVQIKTYKLMCNYAHIRFHKLKEQKYRYGLHVNALYSTKQCALMLNVLKTKYLYNRCQIMNSI